MARLAIFIDGGYIDALCKHAGAALVLIEPDIGNLLILLSHSLTVEGLHFHGLAISAALACVLEFFFFGGKFLDDFLRSDALGWSGVERAFLRDSRLDQREPGRD